MIGTLQCANQPQSKPCGLLSLGREHCHHRFPRWRGVEDWGGVLMTAHRPHLLGLLYKDSCPQSCIPFLCHRTTGLWMQQSSTLAVMSVLEVMLAGFAWIMRHHPAKAQMLPGNFSNSYKIFYYGYMDEMKKTLFFVFVFCFFVL